MRRRGRNIFIIDHLGFLEQQLTQLVLVLTLRQQERRELRETDALLALCARNVRDCIMRSKHTLEIRLNSSARLSDAHLSSVMAERRREVAERVQLQTPDLKSWNSM